MCRHRSSTYVHASNSAAISPNHDALRNGPPRPTMHPRQPMPKSHGNAHECLDTKPIPFQVRYPTAVHRTRKTNSQAHTLRQGRQTKRRQSTIRWPRHSTPIPQPPKNPLYLPLPPIGTYPNSTSNLPLSNGSFSSLSASSTYTATVAFCNGGSRSKAAASGTVCPCSCQSA